jgi:hypothetical protein
MCRPGLSAWILVASAAPGGLVEAEPGAVPRSGSLIQYGSIRQWIAAGCAVLRERVVLLGLGPVRPGVTGVTGGCRTAVVQRWGSFLAWEGSRTLLHHEYMREEESEISEEGWGLKPCPSCDGRGTKYVRPRREIVAMQDGEQDAQPVQVADECLLCAGTGSVQFRNTAQ